MLATQSGSLGTVPGSPPMEVDMATDVLPSWVDGKAKRAITDFVTGATTPGDDFIEPGDRIATFDNDGTLWIEQPVPIQLDFIFRALAQAAQHDPDLAGQDPYK